MKMKKYYVMGVTVALMLAGAVVFNACGSDKDEDPKGVEIAKALCNCAKTTDIMCMMNVVVKYSDYLSIDITSEEGITFKDKTVQADCEKYIAENCKSNFENFGD